MDKRVFSSGTRLVSSQSYLNRYLIVDGPCGPEKEKLERDGRKACAQPEVDEEYRAKTYAIELANLLVKEFPAATLNQLSLCHYDAGSIIRQSVPSANPQTRLSEVLEVLAKRASEIGHANKRDSVSEEPSEPSQADQDLRSILMLKKPKPTVGKSPRIAVPVLLPLSRRPSDSLLDYMEDLADRYGSFSGEELMSHNLNLFKSFQKYIYDRSRKNPSTQRLESNTNITLAFISSIRSRPRLGKIGTILALNDQVPLEPRPGFRIVLPQIEKHEGSESFIKAEKLRMMQNNASLRLKAFDALERAANANDPLTLKQLSNMHPVGTRLLQNWISSLHLPQSKQVDDTTFLTRNHLDYLKIRKIALQRLADIKPFGAPENGTESQTQYLYRVLRDTRPDNQAYCNDQEPVPKTPLSHYVRLQALTDADFDRHNYAMGAGWKNLDKNSPVEPVTLDTDALRKLRPLALKRLVQA